MSRKRKRRVDTMPPKAVLDFVDLCVARGADRNALMNAMAATALDFQLTLGEYGYEIFLQALPRLHKAVADGELTMETVDGIIGFRMEDLMRVFPPIQHSAPGRLQ